ncbi:MAG: RimK/LysX family protein [Marinoscillum sp.]
MKTKRIIGRVELIDLPDLGIESSKAKIDTGAYTSSIHCKKIKLKEDVLSFFLPIEQGGKTIIKEFQTRDFSQKHIKSSNGESQKRYVIKTGVVFFNKRYLAEFSLSDRSRMKNPILIGRKLLKNRFLVDVSLKNVSFDHESRQTQNP